jgi:hypothetical protein
VKVRLGGTPAEVAEATGRLGQVLDVVAVSNPSPDRSPSQPVRVDPEVRLHRPASRDDQQQVVGG